MVNSSQLNRDYAKAMASRDRGLAVQSARRGISQFLLGLMLVFIVLLIFFLLKNPVMNHFHKALAQVSTSVEKPKPAVSVKIHSTSTPSSHVKQDYGFYTELPKMEVKSPHHEDDAVTSEE